MTAELPELLSRAAGAVVDLIATAAEPDDMALTVDVADALAAIIRQERPGVVVAAGLAGGLARGLVQAGIAADGRIVYGLTADGWLDHWTRQAAA